MIFIDVAAWAEKSKKNQFFVYLSAAVARPIPALVVGWSVVRGAESSSPVAAIT
jgi:hypothetical protein